MPSPTMPCPFCATEQPGIVDLLTCTVTDSATEGKVDYTVTCPRHGEHVFRAIKAQAA